MNAHDRSETQITLDNAAEPEAPLLINGPVSLVVVLSAQQIAQRVLTARLLHSVISELHPQTTLRFVRNDLWERRLRDSSSTDARAALAAETARWRGELARCVAITGETPDISLAYSDICDELDDAARRLSEHPDVAIVEDSGTPTTLRRERTRCEIRHKQWRPRQVDHERPFAIPEKLTNGCQGRSAAIAVQYDDGLRATSLLSEPALAQIALSDGLPVVIYSDQDAAFVPVVAAAAELLDLPPTLGFFAQPRTGTVWPWRGSLGREFSFETVAAQLDRATLRHWLLCNVPWKEQRGVETANGVVSEHAEQCRDRVARVRRAQESARALIASAAATGVLHAEVRDELEERYAAFARELRDRLNVDLASQLMMRVSKTLNRVVRDGDARAAREALTMLESMANTVGID